MAQSEQSNDPAPQNTGGDPNRQRSADDGNPQTDRTSEGASPDRQIAQEPQQSTGQGMGQS
jgi:hypothetical protein